MATVPVLQTAADLTSSQAASGHAQLVPSGAILSYAGTAAPTGWLVCDGAPLSTTTYATLFAAIGYTFGGSGGTFNLPDLRGRFVRYDDNMGAHGVSGVTAQNAAARDSGREHGSAQSQATAKNNLSATASASGVTGTVGYTDLSHTHNTNANTTYSNGVQSGPSFTAPGAGGSSGGASISMNHSHTFSGTAAAQAITLSSGDAETRPINIALNAIIKI